MLKYFTLFVFAIFILAPCLLLGQDFRVETYQVEQGLPTNLTKTVLKDSQGFIWVGTDAGILRLDGKKVLHFNQDLPSNYVKYVIKRKNGDILVANDKGISKIENRIDTVLFSVLLEAKVEITDQHITPPKYLFEDSKNRLWIGEDQRISCMTTSGLKHYTFEQKYRTTSWARAFSVVEDEAGNIYASSQRGFLFKFNEARSEFEAILLEGKFSVASALLSVGKQQLWVGTENGIHAVEVDENAKVVKSEKIAALENISFLTKDNKGNFFIGTWNQGLYRAKRENDKITIQKVENLAFKVINDIFIDENGDTWISADDGVALLHQSFFSKPKVKMERNYMIALQQGEDKNIYATEGAAVFQISDSSFIGKNIVNSNQYGTKDVLCVAQNKYGIWVGTSDAMLYRVNGNQVDTINLKSFANKITCLLNDKDDNMWVGQPDYKFVLKVTPDLKVQKYDENKGIVATSFIIKSSPNGAIYCGGNDLNAYLFMYNDKNDTFVNLSSPLAMSKKKEMRVEDLCIDYQNHVWLATTYGLLKYGKDSTRRVSLDEDLEIRAVAAGQDSSLWLGTNFGLIKYANGELLRFDEFNGLPSKTVSHRCVFLDTKNRLWIGTANGMSYSWGMEKALIKTPTPLFISLNINGKLLHLANKEKYVFRNNSYLETNFASLSYPANKILYRYRLVSQGNELWSVPSTKSDIIFPQLESGKYILEIKALQQGAFVWSDTLQFEFIIATPWHLQWWAFILYAILLAGIIFIATRIYARRLLAEKDKLEAIVLARTKEIELQKQEITLQKDELDSKSKLLQQKNDNVMASINYAKRIQDAMLPSTERMALLFPESFILFKPRDVVSGDFYWCSETSLSFNKNLRRQIVAAVDCTGHGVPGAFMSLIANSLLEQACNIRGLEHTDHILAELHKNLQIALQQETTDNHDGFDIALCIIDKSNQQIEFSGAGNPLYFVKDNIFQMIKGNIGGIGGHSKKTINEFTRHLVTFEKEIIFYICSDGYHDQFGGEENKRYSSKRLRATLEQVHKLPMNSQKENLEDSFMAWKRHYKQNDDVLLIGVKISIS
jgi:AraC family chitin signaling transcriptional activator